jgi:hypothetical protein
MTKQEQIKAIIYKHTYHGGTNGVPLTIDVESIAIEIDKLYQQTYHEAKMKEVTDGDINSKIWDSLISATAIPAAYHEAANKQITDEDIEAYFKTWQNPRIKTADEQYEQWLTRYLEELIDSAIEGAKAMRDGEIKHVEK